MNTDKTLIKNTEKGNQEAFMGEQSGVIKKCNMHLELRKEKNEL